MPNHVHVDVLFGFQTPDIFVGAVTGTPDKLILRQPPMALGLTFHYTIYLQNSQHLS